MEDQLVHLVEKYKSGDIDAFVDIQKKMKPLIIKYANILKFDDFEDMFSELTLALLECIHNMQYYRNEHQILYFIEQAIINRFHELYRSSQQRSNQSAMEQKYLEMKTSNSDSDDEISKLLYKQDMYVYIEKLSKKKQAIAYSILIEGLSDIEVGKKYHVTRQYVHRLRKLFYEQLQEYYK